MRARQSGQVMIVVALGITAFIGFLAMAVDLGHAYSQRRLTQNASDAAALAGMRMVRTSMDEYMPGSVIHAEIVRVAGENGSAEVVSDRFIGLDTSDLGPVEEYMGSLKDVAGVQVTSRLQFGTFFARVLGIDTMTAEAKGTAMSLRVKEGGVSGASPIAVPEDLYGGDPLPFGTPTTFFTTKSMKTGNIGWLDLDGGSNNNTDLINWLENGFPYPDDQQYEWYTNGDGTGVQNTDSIPPLDGSSDVWFGGNPGVDTTVLSNWWDYIQANGGSAYITVLIYDDTAQQGSNYLYHIIGYAEFKVTQIDDTGNPKTITGELVSWVTSGAADPGVYSTDQFTAVKLVPNAIPTSLPTPTPWPTSTPTVGPSPTPGPTSTPTATPVPTPGPGMPTWTPTPTPVPPTPTPIPTSGVLKGSEPDGTLAVAFQSWAFFPQTIQVGQGGTLTSAPDSPVIWGSNIDPTYLYFELVPVGDPAPTVPGGSWTPGDPILGAQETNVSPTSLSIPVSAPGDYYLWVYNSGPPDPSTPYTDYDVKILPFTAVWPK